MRTGIRSILTAAAGAAFAAAVSLAGHNGLRAAGVRISCAARGGRPPGSQRHLAGAERSELRPRDAHGAARAGAPARPVRPVPAPPVLALGAVGAVPPGMGVVEGGEIPYKPEALAQKKKNQANWLDARSRGQVLSARRAARDLHAVSVSDRPERERDLHRLRVRRRRPQHLYEGPGPGAGRFLDGSRSARWEGDTLVIDVTGFNDQTWFDRAGNFHSDALHVVERYTRTAPGRHQLRSDHRGSANVFTRPWKISMPLYRRAREERPAHGVQVRGVRRRVDVRPVAQEAAAAARVGGSMMQRNDVSRTRYDSAALVSSRRRCVVTVHGRRAQARRPRRRPQRRCRALPTAIPISRAPTTSQRSRRSSGRRRSATAVAHRRGSRQLEAGGGRRRIARRDRRSTNRTAPPNGGDGSTGAAGNVGGYNTFWLDRGDALRRCRRPDAHVDHRRSARTAACRR